MNPAQETLMTRRDVARAAGVTVQAVTNWARRHPDFPKAVRRGSRSGYPASAVAEWLDSRGVTRPSLLPGEQPGVTYGRRFRAAAGLPAPRGVEERRHRQPADLLDQELWAPLERLLRNSEDPARFESVVLSLLCLGGTDPDGWVEMTRASTETVHDAVLRTQRRQPDHMADATTVLRTIPTTAWWRHRLRNLVGILSPDQMRTPLAFDYLLDRFAQYRHSSSDEYLMPAELAALMVRMLDPGPGSRIHDPCCGAGILLVAAGEHLREAAGTSPLATITGRAATARTRSLATMNVAMHEIQVTLDARPLAAPGEVDAEVGQFDIVLLNPPFGRRDWSLPESHRKQPWQFGKPAPHNSAFAWLQTAFTALAPGGRAAVVMPDSSTFGSTTREQGIRGEMIQRGVVRCVVALPDHLFRETTIPVTVWILERPADNVDRGVLLIDARKATREDGQTHRVLTERSCRTVVDSYKGWLKGAASLPIAVDNVIATAVSVAELRHHGYDLQPVTYLDRRRGEAAEQRVLGRLRTLPAELARLDAIARQADAALDRRLQELAPWIR